MALSLANWAAMSARDLCSMMRSAVSLSPSACRAFPFKYQHLFYIEPQSLPGAITAHSPTTVRVL